MSEESPYVVRVRASSPPLTVDLAEEPGGGTRVTETWDLRGERNRAYVAREAGDPSTDMTATLERIDRLVAGQA